MLKCCWIVSLDKQLETISSAYLNYKCHYLLLGMFGLIH